MDELDRKMESVHILKGLSFSLKGEQLDALYEAIEVLEKEIERIKDELVKQG